MQKINQRVLKCDCLSRGNDGLVFLNDRGIDDARTTASDPEPGDLPETICTALPRPHHRPTWSMRDLHGRASGRMFEINHSRALECFAGVTVQGVHNGILRDSHPNPWILHVAGIEPEPYQSPRQGGRS